MINKAPQNTHTTTKQQTKHTYIKHEHNTRTHAKKTINNKSEQTTTNAIQKNTITHTKNKQTQESKQHSNLNI